MFPSYFSHLYFAILYQSLTTRKTMMCWKIVNSRLKVRMRAGSECETEGESGSKREREEVGRGRVPQVQLGTKCPYNYFRAINSPRMKPTSGFCEAFQRKMTFSTEEEKRRGRLLSKVVIGFETVLIAPRFSFCPFFFFFFPPKRL